MINNLLNNSFSSAKSVTLNSVYFTGRLSTSLSKTAGITDAFNACKHWAAGDREKALKNAKASFIRLTITAIAIASIKHSINGPTTPTTETTSITGLICKKDPYRIMLPSEEQLNKCCSHVKGQVLTMIEDVDFNHYKKRVLTRMKYTDPELFLVAKHDPSFQVNFTNPGFLKATSEYIDGYIGAWARLFSNMKTCPSHLGSLFKEAYEVKGIDLSNEPKYIQALVGKTKECLLKCSII